MNKPRRKGTAGETEFVNAAFAHGVVFERMPASSTFDLRRVVKHTEAAELIEPINALATRPDRGRWLVTMTAEDFWYLLKAFPNRRSRVEVKRFKGFAHHTLFEEKFGGDRSAR